MPSTIDDLAEALRQFFATKFPPTGNGGQGSTLLYFDPLGFPLSASEFSGTGPDHAGDLLAHQRAAELADQIPAANALTQGTYIPRGGSKLSRWYASLVRGSGRPPPSEASALAAFEAAKTEAMQSLSNNELAVVSALDGSTAATGTNDRYYATSMTPVDWYEETSTVWQTYSLEATDDPTPAPSAPPWVPPKPPMRYRVLPIPDWDPIDPHSGRTISAIVDYVRVATESERLRELTTGESNTPDSMGPWHSAAVDERAIRELVLTGELPSLTPDRIGLAVSELTQETPRRTRLVNSIRTTPVVDDTGWRIIVADDTVTETALFGWNPSDFAVAGERSTVDAVLEATTATEPSSSDISVQFEYCLVRFDRPWWDDVFLSRSDWQVAGYASGQLSSGGAGQPIDPLTMVTVGMLVIRNLSITARWSSTDLQSLPRSTSIGPFCIAAASFDGATGKLTRNGYQAIAWLCQVPPKLPPK
ncbi:hypothetical protein GV791_09340 [Nocardia cyriacigeorgica]|uniref:Uncharacterized protein n=1 Tax=Nocardia cyriacigeorgica TaxID=135487 RepID=A0A6P1CN42_9NOCA|nr:hypothetical protein [Nocardia cyriacigeorgica]NEW32764.1 hypothetical protein [Nocardia cyriacigeorgica]BDT87371.1 hypothetical protein FMUAM8_31350 [Nocardia cyriacigeorgica]